MNIQTKMLMVDENYHNWWIKVWGETHPAWKCSCNLSRDKSFAKWTPAYSSREGIPLKKCSFTAFLAFSLIAAAGYSSFSCISKREWRSFNPPGGGERIWWRWKKLEFDNAQLEWCCSHPPCFLPEHTTEERQRQRQRQRHKSTQLQDKDTRVHNWKTKTNTRGPTTDDVRAHICFLPETQI